VSVAIILAFVFLPSIIGMCRSHSSFGFICIVNIATLAIIFGNGVWWAILIFYLTALWLSCSPNRNYQ
jgi:hypothetical protein